ncbi:hypothetical protein ACX3P0_18965 [Mesorhizobium sp. A556]
MPAKILNMMFPLVPRFFSEPERCPKTRSQSCHKIGLKNDHQRLDELDVELIAVAQIADPFVVFIPFDQVVLNERQRVHGLAAALFSQGFQLKFSSLRPWVIRRALRWLRTYIHSQYSATLMVAAMFIVV